MSQSLRILVVAPYGESLAEIMGALRTTSDIAVTGATASAADAEKLARENRPDVVLLDDSLGLAGALALVESLAADLPASALVAITPAGDVDYAREVTLAGARAFLPRPFSVSDLLTAVRHTHQLEARRRALIAQRSPGEERSEQGSRLVAVFSPKGGVGKTTLTVNLAVALQQVLNRATVLVDGHVQFGDVAMALNLQSTYSIVDLPSHVDRLDVDLMEGVLTRHSSGVKALLSSKGIEPISAVPPRTFKRIFNVLRLTYDYIVVDTAPVLDDNALTTLEESYRVVLVINQDLTTIRHARHFLQLSAPLLPRDDVIVVCNRYSPKAGVELEAIEQAIGLPVAITLPDEPGLVPLTLNRGIPFVISHRSTPLARQVIRLAALLDQNRPAAVQPVSTGAQAPSHTEVSPSANGSNAEAPRTGLRGLLRSK